MGNIWSNGLVDWIEGDTAYVSCVFSWMVDKAYMRAVYLRQMGYHVKVGGPAIMYSKSMFQDFDLEGCPDALEKHNPEATFTSRGCIRKCSFCLVPKIEGDLVELKDWKVKPIICDNNLLACSVGHFDEVIDKLLESKLTGIDFNQGLDARLLTDHHAKRFSELPKGTLFRLAWDNIKIEKTFLNAHERLVHHGIFPRYIRVYVLIGYKDTPDDARYRLDKVKSIGSMPNVMRYQPLDARKLNSYVEPGWTDYLLKKYKRYYSNLHIFGKMTLEEYDPSQEDIPKVPQHTLW